MFFNVYEMTNFIFYILFGVCGLLLLFTIVMHIIALFPSKKFPKAKTEHKYAILIPARNESKVIKGILDSIKAQTYDAEKIDTYVIVESSDDPTCKIAKKYPRTHVIIRKHLELKGKGYALDEALQEIFSKPYDYEAFFVFDADNILDEHYIEEMNKTYDAGYEMALGYRNSKNWNDNWVSACSGVLFSIFSTFHNRPRSRLGMGVQICGTGYYIDAKVLQNLGGWKFLTLTEDHEITLYAALNNLKSSYNESAKFYDEQPTSFKQSWLQRLRWCKGYQQVNKIYGPKLIKASLTENPKTGAEKFFKAVGVVPLAFTLIVILSYIFINIGYFIAALAIGDYYWYLPLISFLAAGGALYLFLSLYTLMILITERKNVKINFWNGIVCVLTNPFFMLMYLPIFICSIFKKVEWVPIEHSKVLEKS